MRRYCSIAQSVLLLWSIGSLDAREIELKSAYFAEYGLLPGISIGVERPLVEDPIHSLHIGGEINLIVNCRNYVVIDAEPVIGYRLTLPFGLLFELQTGAGIMYYIPLVYQLRRMDEGDWEPLPEAGMIAGAVHASLGVGWDFTKRTRLPIAFYVDARLVAQYPHTNRFLLFRPVLVIGLRY